VKFGRQKSLFLLYQAGADPPEVSFRLRDHLMDAYPERRREIQEAFKACRAQGLDIADVLVERGSLDPEEWWIVTREFGERPRGRTPARDWIPLRGRIPMLRRIPAAGRVPAAGRIPLLGRLPGFGRIPLLGRRPVLGRIPVLGRLLTVLFSREATAENGDSSQDVKP
jgi:hypothetical protein